MSTIETLLNAAATKSGSDYKTAKMLGLTPQLICDWRAGRKNAQPEDHALVAALAGFDAEEAMVRAMLAKHANTPKGERLLSVLGNVLRRTGAAATLLLFASVGSGTTRPIYEALATMCRGTTRWRQSGHCQIITT